MRRIWLLFLIPAGLALLVKVFMALGLIDNAVVFVRIDIGTLAVVFGGFLTSVLFVIWGVLLWQERQYHQDMVNLQARSAEEHRQFLQRLDHELKNPLTAIQAALVNLSEQENSTTVESIKTQTYRLSRLVADLRKLADLETRPIERSAVDLSQVLKDAVVIVQEQPESAERSLRLSLPQAPWPLPYVLGDHDLLLLALLNLLTNAVKFSQSGATIEVRASEDAEMVIIEVADTGPGIPPEELPYILQELYRGQSARGIPGSGLGLALVKAVTERHGGQVNIRSRINQGTIVTLRLPVGDVTKL
jgi:two-component system OmpR family sensor kinase